MLHTALLRMPRGTPIGFGGVVSPYGLALSNIASVIAPVSLVSMGYTP